MQDFTRKFLTEWRKLKLPFSDKKIIIAVSGGADSCAMAHVIKDLTTRKKLKHHFIVGHFNHKLRGQKSDDDASFVEQFAYQLNFDFISEDARSGAIDVISNIEETARIARYNFLQRIASKTNSYAVLTAHTMNDQAETFLLNLTRGSGIDGLAAMRDIRQLSASDSALLARPMLNWAMRNDVLSYIDAHKISYREDSMNSDRRFKRVRIRKDILPKLEELNPKIIHTLCNSSIIIANEIEILDEMLSKQDDFKKTISLDQLEYKKLSTLKDAVLYRVLRDWLRKRRGNLRGLHFKHFQAVKNLIRSEKSGKIAELPNYQRVIKENGKLLFQDAEVEK